jgi:glycerophosphoryl diester phosphodiesterase
MHGQFAMAGSALQALLPRVIGHRGAAATAPENTLESIREAKRLGAGGVEFDAKLASDGVPLLMHDDTLDRTTSGRGAVAALDSRDIRRLDAGLWFGPQWRHVLVPRLEDALKLVMELDLAVNVEIKPCPGREVDTAKAVAATIQRVWPRRRPGMLLSSFSPLSLHAAKVAAPDLPRGLLIWEKPADWLDQARALDCVTIHCADQYLTPDWAAQIKAAGFGLAVYTVNEPARARVLMGWGVDAIITDRPDAIAAAL